MAAWDPIDVSAAFTDTLVADFGGVFAANTALPPDSKFLLQLDYSSAAQTQVIIYLAPPTNLAEQRIMVWDSQVTTTPDTTQYLRDICTDVPIRVGVLQPFGLYLTKPAGAAWLQLYTTPKMGPGC